MYLLMSHKGLPLALGYSASLLNWELHFTHSCAKAEKEGKHVSVAGKIRLFLTLLFHSEHKDCSACLNSSIFAPFTRK